jgi:hypothetical protein
MMNNKGNLFGGLFAGMFLLWALVVIAFWGVVIYVAWHFISKYW